MSGDDFRFFFGFQGLDFSKMTFGVLISIFWVRTTLPNHQNPLNAIQLFIVQQYRK